MGTVDERTAEQYWLDHVRVALWLSIGFVPVAVANILLNGRGRELAAYGAVLVWVAVCLAIARLPWRGIIARGWVERVTLTWSVMSVLLVTAGLLSRGDGLTSTTVLMYLGSWLFATMSYRPWYVSCVAVAMLGCATTVHLVNPIASTADAVILILLLLLFWPVGVKMADFNHRRLQKVVALNQRLEELASVDGLTGCATHRAFYEQLAAMIEGAADDRVPVALVMADLDHFKRINDVHGHAVGDAVLAAVGEELRAAVRPGDLVGRVGGEEFAVALIGVQAATVEQVVDRVRRGIKAIEDPLSVGISMGVVTAVPSSGTVGHPLLLRADEALYAAKHGGRGRTVWDSDAPTRIGTDMPVPDVVDRPGTRREPSPQPT